MHLKIIKIKFYFIKINLICMSDTIFVYSETHKFSNRDRFIIKYLSFYSSSDLTPTEYLYIIYQNITAKILGSAWFCVILCLAT
jgi:hypothetical protein